MTLIRRGSAVQKHRARLTWLLNRPALCLGVPGIHDDDVTDEGRVSLDVLQREMRTAKLFGASTSDTIQREVIRRLVSELRGESVGVGW